MDRQLLFIMLVQSEQLHFPAARARKGQASLGFKARILQVVDEHEGAVRAVLERRASLLPAGIRKVEGTFAAGTVVELATPRGKAIARGVSNFSSAETVRLLGHPSSEFQEILGRSVPQEAVHRDNLFVL